MNTTIISPIILDEEQRKLLEEKSTGKMRFTMMNDYLSKCSLQQDKYALKGLLAALLHIKVETITDITICNPIELGDELLSKECILDIKLELNNAQIINIEIQSVFQDFWPERTLTYLCRNFDQLKTGGTYSKIKPCVHIGIMRRDIFEKDDPRHTGEFYSEYRMLNVKTHTEYSGKFEIRVLSLNQLDKASDEDKNDLNGLYHWAKVFKASSWEELKAVTRDSKNPMISSLVGTVMKLSAEEKVIQACEARQKYFCDLASFEEEISERNARLAELDASIAQKDASLAEKDAIIAELRKQLKDKDSK